MRQSFAQRVAGSLFLLCAIAIALPAQGAPPKQMAEVLFGEREETACRPGHRDFVLDDLRDLHACIVLPGVEGTHYAQLTFLSPDGNVYQTMTLAFVTADAPLTKPAVSLSGRQHKVKRAGWRGRGETVVIATLPVAGTHIAQHSLVGLWTVRIALDGQSLDWGQFFLHQRK
jgi:hypothetical protein